MKKIFLAVAAAGLLLAAPSCKKGENDPFLSLKSRKARLAGEYEMAIMDQTIQTTLSNGDKTLEVTGINGATGTVVTTLTPASGDQTSNTVNLAISDATFSVKDDGTWSSSSTITRTWSEEGDGFIVDRTDYTSVTTTTESGNWSFLGGQPETFENKERVILNTLDSDRTEQVTTVTHYTFSDDPETNTGSPNTTAEVFGEGEISVIYEIDMLKNKEMVFKRDLSGSTTNTSVLLGISYSTTTTDVGNLEIKFEEK